LAKVAKVILFDTRIPEKDFLFYSIPKEFELNVAIGKAVIVSLKRGKKLGYIWDVLEKDNLDFKLQSIFRVLDEIPPLGKSLIDLVNWISDYYLNSLYKTANYIFPRGIELEITRFLKAKNVALLNMTKREDRVFLALFEEKTIKDLKKEVGNVSESIIRNLLKKEAIEERFEINLKEKVPRKMVYLSEKKGKEWKLADFLEKDKILELIDKPLLLFVESREERWKIYLELIEHYYSQGKGTLVVFPTVESLLQFGDFLSENSPVFLYFYHGFLTEAQAYKVFKIAGTEDSVVVLSTSKGLFLPFKNMGLIIVDQEENEFYNMREKEPRYDSISVALKRADLEKIPIVLGSSAPSVNSFYKGIQKEFSIYRKPLLKRKKIIVLDIRKRREEVLDNFTLQETEKMLRLGKQVFFLLNRLGFSTYIQCQDCGYIFMCPHCNSPLVFHSEEKILKCHYCGFYTFLPERCPNCEGYNFIYGGIGTEKLCKYLSKIFGKYTIQRFDSEVEIQDKSILDMSNIVVGTRIIEPWISGDNVGLLVIYNFDSFLHFPDFAMPEKAFGLVKRIESAFKGEEIIIRTYSPNHYVLRALKIGSYGTFLSQELTFRKMLFYPPFSYLHQVILEGIDEEEVLGEGNQMVKNMENYFGDNIEILGPAPFVPPLIKGKYRYHIVIKTKDVKGKLIGDIIEKSKSSFSNVKITINIDVKEII